MFVTIYIRNWINMQVGHTLLVVLLSALVWSPSSASEKAAVHVSKTSGCGCCVAWIEHLEDDGMQVSSENMAMGNLMRFKMQNGVSAELASCHTAKVGGYTIEGHVPADEIKRLLSERPKAIGLAVPGMPLGSPGMDQGPEQEKYDILLIRADGSTEVYATYPSPN